MASPDHNETIDIAKAMGSTYEVTGYAYTGGGRLVTRVEVSTDNGVHWELATLHRKEQPTEHGMYWCWTWWTYELPVADLVGCKEIMCRAWDESNNPQPMNPTWNLMGMGNNQVFRVKVHVDKTAAGKHVFRFEHPTQPGQQTGGWMTKTATKPDSAGFGRLLEVQAGETNRRRPHRLPRAAPASCCRCRKSKSTTPRKTAGSLSRIGSTTPPSIWSCIPAVSRASP